MKIHRISRTVLMLVIALMALVAALVTSTPRSSAFMSEETVRPSEFDVRGVHGVPKGTFLRRPTAPQAKALDALQAQTGVPLQVEYNGLTATPRHLFSHAGYLTGPSGDAPETIARGFLSKWAGVFRFSEEDLQSLRLRTRATLPDLGTTILVYEQTAKNLRVYRGEVLVNVNRAGQIISVGSESFPQMKISNTESISPEQAIIAAAMSLGVSNFTPQAIGTRKVQKTFGDLPQEFEEGLEYSGGGVFGDDITVTQTVFPLGDEGRIAYKFNLTTPQYEGAMWENIVDAQTGKVLRRLSLTAFQAGGGVGVGRRSTFRPDVQDMVEGFNPGGTATGKVFDAIPTTLSGRFGVGRAQRAGTEPNFTYTQPIYVPESQTVRNSGRGFKYSQVSARNENPLPFGNPAVPEVFTQAQLTQKLGQTLRGLPDAANPTPNSPFGWFYLPTGAGGAEIVSGDANRAGTRAFGYTMSAEAKGRNLAANSPGSDGDQPYSATVTPLGSSVALSDGRTLSSVIQSNYTEGNNTLAADDHGNDNESTHGIKGFNPTRQFTASYFDFINSYEFNPTSAGGTPFFPPSTHPDVYPAAVSLFYSINIMHDHMYSIGFTEPLWNFQQDNFGKGGAGRDAVSGQVMDGSGTNNANFGTPADGSAPRMQMFLWTETGTRRADGDFDFDVVAHEFYHGVSNRSAGKGETGCLGLTLVGESGGQGEGWSDTIAESMTDDDITGEYVTGEFDVGIRRLPVTNFRWSYGSINQRGLTRRDQVLPPDVDTGTGTPFAVHRTGEVWSATLWDMRELLIMKNPNGVFYDGTRRLGTGTNFFVGNRQIQSVDAQHPINYRVAFNTQDPATINATQAIVRPGMVAQEIASLGHRNGPLATAVRQGARLADTLVLRGLQLSPCNPSYVDSRNSILMADREMSGGENRAVIWRAFASHGVGVNAASSAGAGDDQGTQSAPIVVEDFSVPAGVTQCETMGPLAAPDFTLTNTANNTVRVTIVPAAGANRFLISRADNANGPFALIANIPASQTTFDDNNGGQGLPTGSTFFYQVRASRDANADCVSTANTQSITITIGVPVIPNPVFAGLNQVEDPRACDRLILSWLPAVSANPNADIVYDIYRTNSVAPGDGTQDPMFTPSSANRIQAGVRGTSFTDINLVRNQVYYYIVQARDLNNGRIDTNNTGNRVVRFNAPTSPVFAPPPVFANETFETASANTRFTPPLPDSATPNENLAAFQRVPNVDFGGGVTSAAMFAPNLRPNGADGAPSDFSATIGPLTLTGNSIMEFDHFFGTEAAFDGGVMEIAIGSPNFNATPFPDNVTTFDLGNHMIQNGYNAKLDGTLAAGVFLSPLQGRRAFTGIRGLARTRIALRAFAMGGTHNPNGLPVYIRFRMTSDAATAVGRGWYIDNVVVNNLAACPDTPAPVGLQYYPLPRPLRLLDTRAGQPACDNPGAPLAGNSERVQNARVTCDGITIPAEAVALVGNATIDNTTSSTPGGTDGFATLYPADTTRPMSSNLNYVAGQAVPNAFVVGLGVNGPSAGQFKIYTSSTTNGIIDVTGYYAPPGTGGLYYHALARPVRLLDTRANQPDCENAATPLVGGTSRPLLARRTCEGLTIPASARTVVGNATVVNDVGGSTPGQTSFVTLYPSGVERPTASNLNYTVGQIVPNAFTVALGTDGAFQIYATEGINFIVDVTGYYSDQPTEDGNGLGLFYFPLASPLRLLDTRANQPDCENATEPLAGGAARTQMARVTCEGVTIPAGTLAIAGNATVVNTTANATSGFGTLYPSGVARPTASNVNYVAGQIVPNMFVVGLGGDGAFQIYVTSETHFIVDIAGFFAP